MDAAGTQREEAIGDTAVEAPDEAEEEVRLLALLLRAPLLRGVDLLLALPGLRDVFHERAESRNADDSLTFFLVFGGLGKGQQHREPRLPRFAVFFLQKSLRKPGCSRRRWTPPQAPSPGLFFFEHFLPRSVG